MRLLLLSVAALALTGAAPRDWTKTVTSTTNGWRAGNPAAPRKLVEYGALNCPHCALFAKETDEAVMARVRTGKLSFEYRPFQIFPHDPAATLVARCVPLQRRFAFVHDYYANQSAVTARLRTALEDPANAAALDEAQAKGAGAANQQVLRLSGMAVIARRHGLAPAAANRCVADPAGIAWLRRTQAAGQAQGVESTPTYYLNGKKLDLRQPEELLALLR